MKRWIAVIPAVFFLLTGCVTQDRDETTMESTTVETTQPDPGLYEPESTIEKQTSGAVRAYPLGGRAGSYIIPVEDDILLFSDGGHQTDITRLTGENCVVAHTAVADGNIYDVYGSVRIWGNKLGYYDGEANSVVFLDGMLQEIERVEMPADMQGTPLFSQDLNSVYYCTPDAIRVLRLDTGISRLIRQQECQFQVLEQVLFSDTVLQCSITNDTVRTEFISTETGETVGTDANLEYLEAWEDCYFLRRSEGVVRELLFGNVDGRCMTLLPAGDCDSAVGLLPIGGVLTSLYTEGAGTELNLHDLESGLRSSSLVLPESIDPYGFIADASGTYIWFLALDQKTQTDVLYRWDIAVTEVDDETVCVGPRYTQDDPDTNGLTRCQSRADAIGNHYGVKILLGETPPQPEGYTFTYEYQVSAFQVGLDALEQILDKFPEGFFAPLEGGNLRIGLVRQISGPNYQEPTGLQYWLDGEGYIAISVGDTMERSFCHELSFVLDAYIYANSTAYDLWENLNPAGFRYDGNYTLYQERKDMKYLEGDSRAFIDEYSKTFAREDRARIFEYAMMEGNQEVFAPQTMQRKLGQMCKAIRDAYEWKKDERTFPWEQYLN